MIMAGGGLRNLRLIKIHPAVAAAIRTIVPATHQTQAQLFGISTGGLMARISLVASGGDGTTNAAPLEVRGMAFLPPQAALFAHDKEAAESDRIGLVRAQFDGIHSDGTKK